LNKKEPVPFTRNMKGYNKKIIGIVGMVISLLSCQPFPQSSDVIGSWIEEEPQSGKHRLVFDDLNIAYFISLDSIPTVDTLTYELDPEHHLIHFGFLDNPGTSDHRIEWDGQNFLMIEGLGYFWIPEASPPKVKFKRE
jgi:hypothetical protein